MASMLSPRGPKVYHGPHAATLTGRTGNLAIARKGIPARRRHAPTHQHHLALHHGVQIHAGSSFTWRYRLRPDLQSASGRSPFASWRATTSPVQHEAGRATIRPRPVKRPRARLRFDELRAPRQRQPVIASSSTRYSGSVSAAVIARTTGSSTVPANATKPVWISLAESPVTAVSMARKPSRAKLAL